MRAVYKQNIQIGVTLLLLPILPFITSLLFDVNVVQGHISRQIIIWFAMTLEIAILILTLYFLVKQK